jgi:hypothetical protein
MEMALQTSHARELATFDAKNRGLIGRFSTALNAAREVRKPQSGRFHLAWLTISFALSPAAIRDNLAARQRSELEALTKVDKARLTSRIAEAKATRESELSSLTASHGKAREALIFRQGAEKGKMKEAWRAAPQPERAKREKRKSEEHRERRRDDDRDKSEGKRQRRDRRLGHERGGRSFVAKPSKAFGF